MDSLLSQGMYERGWHICWLLIPCNTLKRSANLVVSLTSDIGFFDTTKTGDITSRLSSDTTLVGDQVTLNVNVFLRSVVQAVGVLIFMFVVSWQLSIIAFISVPVVTALSKWYGHFLRSLTKLMQKKVSLSIPGV